MTNESDIKIENEVNVGSHDFAELFIDEQMIIKNAIKQMDRVSQKILFVTDDNNRLMGTMTSGDIRRWILSNGDLYTCVEKIYNKNPVFATDMNTKEDMKKIMLDHKIQYLPVINRERNIINVIFWGHIFGDGKEIHQRTVALDIPVVVMAGGQGSRMDPFTKILPKPLIPVSEDRPIISVIIEEFRNFGISDFYLMLNYKGEMIESYFNHIDKDYSLHYTYEEDFLGTAGGLKLLAPTIGDDFIVSNCDVIVKADFEEVVHFHRSHQACLTVLSSIQHHKLPYGVMEFKNGGEVIEIKEKPEYTFTINTGLYVLNKEVLEYIPSNTSFDMTDLVEELLKNNKKVITYPVNESDYIDVGQWDEYKKSIEKLKSF